MFFKATCSKRFLNLRIGKEESSVKDPAFLVATVSGVSFGSMECLAVLVWCWSRLGLFQVIYRNLSNLWYHMRRLTRYGCYLDWAGIIGILSPTAYATCFLRCEPIVWICIAICSTSGPCCIPDAVVCGTIRIVPTHRRISALRRLCYNT